MSAVLLSHWGPTDHSIGPHAKSRAPQNSDVMPHIGFEASLVVGAVALIASTLAAVTGFGGAAVLLPVLVIAFGVRDAVPILTVAQLIGNASRVWFNRRELDYRVVAWFALGGVPSHCLAGCSLPEHRSLV